MDETEKNETERTVTNGLFEFLEVQKDNGNHPDLENGKLLYTERFSKDQTSFQVGYYVRPPDSDGPNYMELFEVTITHKGRRQL